jgi:hypothetical protein
MEQENRFLLIIGAWTNAFLGSLLQVQTLSVIAYCGSILGSAVYIYTTIKKNKNEKTNK